MNSFPVLPFDLVYSFHDISHVENDGDWMKDEPACVWCINVCMW